MRDEQYEAQRNALIPQAEKTAYEIAGDRPEKGNELVKEKWNAEWNYAFHTTMNKLAKEAGITK